MTEIANTDQYEAWNGDSGQRWVIDADRRDHILAPVADALLAAAHLGAGEAVVDVGCGCGATTLAAAHAVGPTGAVYGIDLSGPMLDVARRRAAVSGLANITLVQGDVQTHHFPAPSDAAISRFGTMFFADQTAALASKAGYADPQLDPVKLTLTLGADPDEAVDYLAGTGVGRTVLDSVPDDQQPAALEAVRAGLADHHTQADGVRLGAAIWIVTADNPT